MKTKISITISIIFFTIFACKEVQKNDIVIINPSKEKPFIWEGANLYFLLTDRFNNADTTNDLNFGRTDETAVLRGFKGGDIKGITQKINETIEKFRDEADYRHFLTENLP